MDIVFLHMLLTPEMHPEQGPIWSYINENIEEVMERLGANLRKPGPGSMRKIHQSNLDELDRIFEVSGGYKLYNDIERFSEKRPMRWEWNLKKKEPITNISDTCIHSIAVIIAENKYGREKKHLERLPKRNC
ncbi:MAG: hypothetical protein MZV63_44755 [Marinilabiliales bacterium]|nr:hypothetical protein [Marinilabiliales bacterium]